ncbi:hypothetical protein [Pseudomonas sichuanensis]|uniref:hypothetical protein n=1 Tax=Pseudomonas TaxID=286 RepID=UPI0036E438CF
MEPTLFRYLLLSEDDKAVMVATNAAFEGKAVHDHKGMQAFLSTKGFKELYADIDEVSKQFALIQVNVAGYHTSDAALAGTLKHLNQPPAGRIE